MTRSFQSFSAVTALAAALLLTACGPSTKPPPGFTSCASPEVICLPPGGGAAACINIANDPNNCGGCGNVCEAPGFGGTATCVLGSCTPVCPGSETVCGIGPSGHAGRSLSDDAGVSDAGTSDAGASDAGAGTGSTTVATLVCIDTATDPNHCGECDTRCLDTQVCHAGACVPAGIPGQGATACGTQADGGVIYKNLEIDPLNCGACGNACAANEICLGGACDPCGFEACNNTCVDLNTDPNNCGACGVAVAAGGSCNNGKPWTVPVVSIATPTTLTLSAPLIPAGLPTIGVTVESGVRLASVQVVAVLSVFTNNNTTLTVTTSNPLKLQLTGDANVSPTTWSFPWNTSDLGQGLTIASTLVNNAPSGSVNGPMTAIPATPNGGTAANVKLTFTAFDEQYMAGRSDAASHESVALVVNSNVATVQTFTSQPLAPPTMETPARALATGSWVPLNGAPITIHQSLATTSTLSTLTPSNIVGVEFHSMVTAQDVTLGGTNSVIPISNTGPAAITVNPNDLGVGVRTIQAKLVDIFGNRLVGGPTVTLTVGDVRTAPGTLPVLAHGTDGIDAIWMYSPNVASAACGTVAPIFAQDATKTAADPTKVGSAIGTASYCLGKELVETFESSGVFGIRADGTGIDRLDAMKPPATTPYIAAPQGVTFANIESSSISGQALAVEDTTGSPWYAIAGADGGDAAPEQIADAGAVVPVASFTGTPAARFTASSSGALWGWVRSTPASSTQYQLALFHPAIGNAGAHIKSYAAAASSTPTAMTVFPGGEYVWQETTNTGVISLGAGRFDGVNPPVDVTNGSLTVAGTAATYAGDAFPVGYKATTGIASNSAGGFFVPKAGVIVGYTPSATTTTATINPAGRANRNTAAVVPAGNEIIEIDLTGATAKIYQPLQMNLNTTNARPLVGNLGAVASRWGVSTFTVSDDQTKVLFVTSDPVTGGPNTFSVHLLDLATGTQTQLFTSPYLDQTGGLGTPHFLHGMNSYAALPQTTSPIAIWGEVLPVATPGAGSTETTFERLYYANYSGSTVTPVQINQLAFASIGNKGAFAQLAAESVTANAIFFLGEDGSGEFSLFKQTFDGSASAQRLVQGVTNWQLREDVARQIVLRSDGTILAGSLSGGAALSTLYKGDSGAELNVSLMPLAGLTPDGNHAWALVHVGELYMGNTQLLQSTLLSFDLASASLTRTDWGETINQVMQASGPYLVSIGSTASTIYGIDRASMNEDMPRAFSAAAATGATNHSELKLSVVGSRSNGQTRVSLDLNEAIFEPLGVDVTADVTTAQFYSSEAAITSQTSGRVQPDAPIYGPMHLPQWEIAEMNGSGIFKQFGGAAFHPLINIAAGGTISAQQARLTPDFSELLGGFTNSVTGYGYVMKLPGIGSTLPTPAPQ